jgi:phosphoglycolate phosphatase-like HAD superfamily hydrolase
MEPTLILFDVDGTLVDTAGAGRRAFIEVFGRMFGADGVEEAATRVRFQGKTDPIIIDEIVRNLGIDAGTFERRRDEFWTLYAETLERILARPDPRRRVLPGVVALLVHLDRRAGVYLGLQTGNVEVGARAKLRALDLERFFPGGGFASDHRDRRAVARSAWKKLSRVYGIEFAASETVVIGDTGHDVDCGRANGFRTVAVDTGWVDREELEASRPDALLDDLTDLDAVLSALGIRRVGPSIKT